MFEELTIDEENVVCFHQLVIRIDQMEDGNVMWSVTPDEAVMETWDLSLFELAESGASLAALSVTALVMMCHEGVVYHAIRQGTGAQLGVERLLGRRPSRPLEDMPMESVSIN